MSRTVRRKNYIPVSWKRDSVYCEDGYWKRVWLEGNELAQAISKYHRCKHGYWTFPSKWLRSDTEASHRMEAKKELDNYKKDPDYEVQIGRKKLLPWD